MLKKLQKWLKRHSVNLNESATSMILGAAVVLLIGLLAYNYFRTHNNQAASTQNTPPEVSEEQGEIATPTATVALPATHTVAAGESLWSIAEMYYTSGFNYVDIAKANNINNPSSIEVGQKLTIPKTEVRAPETTNTAITQTVTQNRIEGNSYTVVRGDDLWNIAVRAYGDGFRWAEIARVNNLVNPQIIHAGNVFVIPRP